MNKRLLTICQTFLVSLLISIPLAVGANPINLGTLDIRLANGEEQIRTEINPGESHQAPLQISNFSDQTKHLKVYASDAELSDETFVANSEYQLSRDITPWVNLPTDYLKLSPGESKIISVNIVTPDNAGIGLHTGAIMIKEEFEGTDNNLSLEKGIRIYANIKGNPAPNLETSHTEITITNKHAALSTTYINSGNTDLKGQTEFSLKDLSGNVLDTHIQDVYLKPGESTPLNFSVDKPYFGLFNLELNNDLIEDEALLFNRSQIFLPIELAIIGILILSLLTLLIARLPKLNFAQIRKNLNSLDFSIIPQKLAFQRATAFTALFAISIIAVVGLKSFNNDLVKADLFSDYDPENNWYQLEIIVGETDQFLIPSADSNVKASISISNADLEITKFLNKEQNDSITLNNNTINFEVNIENDYDGIVALVKPTALDLYPQVKIDFPDLNHQIKYNLVSLTGPPIYHQFGAGYIQLHATETERKNAYLALPLSADLEGLEDTISTTESTPEQAEEITFGLTVDQLGTAEIGITSKQSTPNVTEDLKLLESVIEDIPSTPESLSEYILNSNYVYTIATQDSTTKVISDPALIDALGSEPGTLEELVATPDLNFIFIPNQKVKFTPQQFSFDNSKITFENIGDIIFVQNRETAWNTYVTVTNFVSLNGRSVIPASAITIEPGEIRMISSDAVETIIQAGEEKQLQDSEDQSLLVQIDPQNAEEAIFVMNPSIKVEVPPETPPGIYRAEISIKTL